MDTTPSIERLKDAYAIIDGIPEEAICLDAPRTASGPALDRGTICSPAGWLVQHPLFAPFGLSISRDGRTLQSNGEDIAVAAAMAALFDIPVRHAASLFGRRTEPAHGQNHGKSDKAVWLGRVRRYLSGELPEKAPETGERKAFFQGLPFNDETEAAGNASSQQNTGSAASDTKDAHDAGAAKSPEKPGDAPNFSNWPFS